MNRSFSMIFRLLSIVVLVLLIAGLLYVWYQDWNIYQLTNRGTVQSLHEPLPALHIPRYGVNVALEQYQDEQSLRQALDSARQAGLTVIRQELPWAEIEPEQGVYQWDKWDMILRVCKEYKLEVIAILDTSPMWARAEWEADNRWAPPSDYQNYASFAAAVAKRYGADITAYQIWDKPNISPYWGNGEINPQAYVELLRTASNAIHSIAPQALIIAGGMAPTVEQSGKNLNDIQFLREINRRGAGSYYDILGIHILGFWSGPDDREVAEDKLNFSRAVLAREELVRRGLGDKPIWALDTGWCALPPDWQGNPSPTGNDTEYIQAQRLEQAMNRIEREWPWLGLAILQQLQPHAAVDDPIWGYSLLTPDGQPRLFYNQIRTHIEHARMLYPGITPRLDTFSSQADEAVVIPFYGTAAALRFTSPSAADSLIVKVDKGPAKAVSVTELTWFPVARHLPPQQHTLDIQGTNQQIANLAVRIVLQADPLPIVIKTIAALLGTCLLVYLLIKTLRALPLICWWRWLLRQIHRAPAWSIWLTMVCTFLLGITPVSWKLVSLAIYTVFAFLVPQNAMYIAVFCVPLAPLQTRVGPGSFSIAEVSLLIAVAATFWQALFDEAPLKGRLSSIIHHLALLDYAVIVLLVSALIATSLAEYQRVAWREFRVVILDSILFYCLIRTQARNCHEIGQVQLVLIGGAFCLAAYAFIAFLSPSGVVETEGVRRARAYFGSPNNLALYLERVLPSALILGIGTKKSRKWVFLTGAGLIFIVIVLTFSRGALLLGIPAGIITLIGFSKSRWHKYAPLVILAIVLVLLPIAGTERITSLFDLSQGTSFIRLSLWRASWMMIRDNPVWGVGPDNFLYYYQDYIQPGAEVERFLSHPHNILLDFWLRLGIGGLVALALVIWGICKSARQLHYLPADSKARRLMAGCLAGLAAAGAHGLVDSSFFVIELAYWAMITLALLHNMVRQVTQSAPLTKDTSSSILHKQEA